MNSLLKKAKNYNYSEKDEKLLLQISIGTIKKRIIGFKKKRWKEKRNIWTQPSELKRIISIFFHRDWNKKDVGHGR